MRRLLARIDRRVLRSMLYVPAVAAVFVIFRATEWSVDHYLSAGKGGGLMAALAISIALGVVFQLFHHRVETAVDHWLHRGEHARLHGLEALAEEIPLISDAGELQQRVLDRIEEVMLTTGAAIYAGHREHRFALVRQNGASNPPEITKNDPALLHLRLHHKPTSPKTVGSPAPFTMLWPMMLRGELIGCLAAGERRHKESLDAAEIKAISAIADAVGVALAMLDPALVGAEVSPPNQGLAEIDESTPSIAVMPFVNMSRDSENEYFADGLSEELLNVLARISGLRVASRTSAFSFKGRQVDIPTVARKLNVATVLDGSVRADGKRVRVTAQLIRAKTDSQLWSEAYDRQLDDIFAVQDDIAKTVVHTLRTTLLGASATPVEQERAKAEVEAAAIGRSENSEAYQFYLRARFFREQLTQEAKARAIQLYLQAIQIDAGYALAWAGLSRAYSDQAGQGWVAIEEGYGRARAAALHAIELEPNLAEAHTALGWVRLMHDWDWEGAQSSFQRALELAPGNAVVMNAAALMLATLGKLHEAIDLCGKAAMLDPLNIPVHRNLAVFALAAGELDAAETMLHKVLEMGPPGGITSCWLGYLALARGRPEEALELMKKEVKGSFRLMGLAVSCHALGRHEESRAALNELIEKHGAGSAHQVAGAHAGCGDLDGAFEWFERAYAARDPGLTGVLWDPSVRCARADARWMPLLRKMKLVA